MDSNVRPEEIPDGFTAADPTGHGGDAAASEKDANAKKQQDQKRAILEQALTSEALARLGTIRLVKPDKVSAVESLITSMAMSGKLTGRINEGKLIEMLEGIGAKQKSASTSSISIQRKKYNFDSDSSDNDDDLM
mmetsp:Transcript_685/g.754  ORF Transcript_685/g.754 Transcript_685/m.754 type:complete len:135 (+) Transcript_685:101-505(+)|eukprot:CAMPEP_0198262372 /NCGR_PEP_ID=MMETSP1447-20131203/10887_1 /TAXON_ID=420782 /ORGANISM="Chaetoceros dichaeta, Strain CCMP1751" /LENGTH=134 /DNA_ID=CAMNT_0043950577 /DNA_START=63 /DNA_END=467 /DNA_ORIENTATION=-